MSGATQIGTRASDHVRCGAVPTLVTEDKRPLVLPLRSSLRLRGTSAQAAALTRHLYACAPLQRTIDAADWYFRWRHVTGPFAGALLQLRIDGVELTVGLDECGPFDTVLADALQPSLPPVLRVAYLSGAGAALWRALETVARGAVEVVDVRRSRTIAVAADSVGFELRRGACRPAARGFVCADDDKARRILLEASQREMPRAAPPVNLPVHWVAVVGATTLPATEVRALEGGDTVLMDATAYSAKAIECRLYAGANRRFAGRCSLQHGKLRMDEFVARGNAEMNTMNTDEGVGAAEKSDTGPAQRREAAFGDIEVTLQFQLAQWQASLADIAALAPGTVIDIGRSIDEPSVSVWAEQRCIGQGQLVAVGDRLGVRLLSVFGAGAGEHAASGAAQPCAAAVAEPHE